MPQEDKDYPVSLLYVDTEIEVQKGQQRHEVADETLGQLQALMRLFQAGDIYLRRHKMWKLEQGKSTLDPAWIDIAWSLKDFRYIRPEPEPIPLYERPEYKLDDEGLAKFIEFFNSYWNIVCKKPQPLYTVISRFSSSYEKRTLADRLVELMIAMEALFGDKGELTYKISLRSACLLYPAGEAREEASKTIKRFYEERSNIIHGKSLASKFSDEQANLFEDHVRRSIVKFLQLYKEGHPITSSTQLDRLLFFTRQTDQPRF